jgi:hypothetical protein
VNTQTVSFDVTDDGYTKRSGNGPYKARIALSWKDKDAFEAQLADRLLAK